MDVSLCQWQANCPVRMQPARPVKNAQKVDNKSIDVCVLGV